MSSFGNTVAASLWPMMAQQYGEEVTYTPADGSGAVAVTAVFQEGRGDTQAGQAGRDQVRTATATLSTGPGGVASPAERDTLLRAGVTWTVRAFANSAPGLVELALETRTQVDRGRPGYWNK